MSRFRLVLSDTGIVELLDAYGRQLWTSATDREFVEYLGDDTVEVDDIGDVLDYLVVERRLLTDDEADRCRVDVPRGETPYEEPDDDEPDEDDDDDDEDEDGYEDEYDEGANDESYNPRRADRIRSVRRR